MIGMGGQNRPESPNRSAITVGSNPEVFPGTHEKDVGYLNAAISMGFKILPGKRFAKLVNPFIKTDWFYSIEEDYFKTSERFSEIVQTIECLGGGYTQYINLITTPLNKHLNSQERLRQFKGNIKSLNEAIAEWSDGDSIALHIAYGLAYFCTNDYGKNAKQNAALGPKVYKVLNEKFAFKKLNPFQLIDVVV